MKYFNKLEVLLLANLFSLSYCFGASLGAYRALPTNAIFSWKGLLGTNALAYLKKS
jgi:hypothetical protein